MHQLYICEFWQCRSMHASYAFDIFGKTFYVAGEHSMEVLSRSAEVCLPGIDMIYMHLIPNTTYIVLVHYRCQ